MVAMVATHTLLLCFGCLGSFALWFELPFLDVLLLGLGLGAHTLLAFDQTDQHLFGELVVLGTADDPVPDCFF